MMNAPKAYEVCNLLAAARSFRLRGWWSGSAYRYHPCGVVREGMIFTNEWNVNRYCAVDVMLDPTSPLAKRCHNPAAYGNASCRPERGGTLRVYYTGRWTEADGPWRAKILRVLQDLRDEIQLASEAARLDKRETRWIAQDAKARKVERARAVMA